jgi:membrane protease YdiL (CAAX protease family)
MFLFLTMRIESVPKHVRMITMTIQRKQWWMSNALIVASFVLVLFFPTEDNFQTVATNSFFLVIMPLVFIRYFLREPWVNFGFSMGNISQGIGWLLFFLGGTIVALAGTYRYTHFLSTIAVPLSVRSSFVSFLLYISIVATIFFIQEIFFRGFVLNIWKRLWQSTGAIFAQAILAVALSFFGSSTPSGAILLVLGIASLCGGFIASRSQSILYSFFFFFISAILTIVTLLIFVR